MNRCTVRSSTRAIAIAGVALGSFVPHGVRAADDALPTLEQVVARHVEARGGLEALREVRSMEVRGAFSAFSVTRPFTLLRERPDRLRFEFEMLDQPQVRAFDGAVAWGIDPLRGRSFPVPLGGAEALEVRALGEFDGPLVDWEAKGYRVRWVGRGEFEGTPAWELEVEIAEGVTETWFLDVETYLAVARLATATDFGQPSPARMVFMDHREVDGIVVPHRVELEFSIRYRVWEIEQVRFDVDIPDTRFEMPLPGSMAALAPWTGTWDVAVETRPAPQAPWSSSSTRSVVKPHARGALLVESTFRDLGGVSAEIFRTLSYDRFRDVYRVTQFDGVSGANAVLEGAMGEDGAIVVSNLDTGHTLVMGETVVHSRMTLRPNDGGGFVIEGEISTDGGESWFHNSTATYVRASAE